MKKTLHVEGVSEDVLTSALVSHQSELGKLKKKLTSAKVDTTNVEHHDAVIRDLLQQLGYVPKKGGGVEVTVDDRQMPLPLGSLPAERGPRVTCLVCSRLFAVPAGDVKRRCPDCGTVHHIVTDEEGTLFRRHKVVEPPDDIRELLLRDKDPKAKKLTKGERALVETWLEANPEYTTDAELVERGDRVADPEVPGSGNPLRIDCSAVAGTECAGFDTTDTPGVSVCPHCGQKYVIELVEGQVVARSWSLDDQIDAEEAEAEAEAEGAEDDEVDEE